MRKLASIRKHAQGFRAEVARRGVRRSKVFPTKQAAKDWAARQEYLILNGEKVAAATPFKDVLQRYANEVSPTKRGERWEVIRLNKIGRDSIGRMPISAIKPSDIADWRDRRLREVAPGSVKREMNLIGSVLTQARREWGMINENPMAEVRKPSDPQARERRVTDDELERMGYVAGDDMETVMGRAFAAFLFAIETGMRAGEILSLTDETVDPGKRVARLPATKNGTARNVPLSTRAVEIWDALPGDFRMTSRQLDGMFRKIRDKAGVEGLTFHDSRHEAITRLARVLDPLALAKMVGHKDIRMLLTYFDESAEDMAKRLS